MVGLGLSDSLIFFSFNILWFYDLKKKIKPKTTDRAGDHFQEICSLWNWASNWECTDLFRLLSLNTRMGNLNSRNFFAHSSRGWRSTVKMPVALVCGEVCRWGLPIVPSRGLLSVHKQERGLGRENTCMRESRGVSASSKDTSPVKLESHNPMTLFNPWKAASPNSHIGGWSFNLWIWRGHSSVHNRKEISIES